MADEHYDMGDLFRAKRLASNAKREKNREDSTQLLRERGIFFTAHNQGAHLIVADKWDFWAGTGRWRERKGRAGHPKREGRGVFNLLKEIEKDASSGA